MNIYFSDVFQIEKSILEKYGAFNISLITDLPLFIDPFLLFASDKTEYKALHNNILKYLRFLKDKSSKVLPKALVKSLYCFHEVEQNWLGFCTQGNTGQGLGLEFANELNNNLEFIFKNFGNEQITECSHLEKLCLIADRVGKDKISDFTTNLIKEYLLSYTEEFAKKYLKTSFTKFVSINEVYFDYNFGRWMPKAFTLPYYKNDYVLLTPKDILTKDETWINKNDFRKDFDEIPNAIENDVLRAQINEYFHSMLPQNDEPTRDEHNKAVSYTVKKYPQLIDYFIKYKEDNRVEGIEKSKTKVNESKSIYIDQFGIVIDLLESLTDFYKVRESTSEATLKRINFFKDVIENKGGYKCFYHNNIPIKKEEDLQILFRFTWFNTNFDVGREANDGRGPVDYKISQGTDKTLVEFKLAKSSSLKRNLDKQLDIYKKASDAETGFFVILYFSLEEYIRTIGIINDLGMKENKNIILIDARADNKPSASKA